MSPARADASAAGRVGWGTVLLFAIVFGGVAEAFELLRIHVGGVAPLAWPLRGALWLAYGVIGGLVLATARLLLRRGALAVAATVAAALVVVPWLNFAYLPRAGSAASLLGSAAALVALAVLVPVFVRRPRLALAAALLFIAIGNALGLGRGSGGGAVPLAQRPLPFNVVVVLIDTLRADHLGAYGYERPTSPSFDALAREATLFDGVTAQAPWTKPSVASLMTGRFVHHHGVVSSRDALADDAHTLAEAMRDRGYRTAAFSGNPWVTPEFRFDQGFAEFESGRAMGPQLTVLYRTLRRLDRVTHLDLARLAFWGASANLDNSERDRQLTDSAVKWIGEQTADAPFFLYVHLIGPHDPYDPPLEYVRRFREPGWDGRKGPTKPPTRVQTDFDTAAPLGDSEKAALIAQYDGAIAFADEQLGRVVEALRRSGQLDRTLLVVTADHGEEFYEHRNWRHGNQLYGEVVHVPLLFRFPNAPQAARRNDLAMLVDLFPTLVALVDGAAVEDKTLDGRPLFAADAAQVAATAFSEHWWFDGGTYSSRMVRRGGMKLLESRDETRGQERTELYDLATDASEQRNLLENPTAVSENGLGELQGLLARFGDKVSVASAVRVDVEQSTKERLRQLGY
ncbi:sulfatase [bacterium]|nr:sulfatase [bacterium]